MLKIKRPLATTGFTFFITGSIILSMPKEYIAIPLALFALFAILHYKTRKIYTKHLLLMFTSAVVAVIHIFIYDSYFEHRINSIPTEQYNFTGYISEVNNSANSNYTVNILKENGSEDFKVTVFYSDGLAVGDAVNIQGKFQPVKRNKYMYSSYAENIMGTISVKELTVVDCDIKTPAYYALKAKTVLLKSAEDLYRKDSLAVVNAIAFNDKHFLSRNVKDDFAVAGLSHTLVVSGLHVWILIGALSLLLKYLPLRKTSKNIITATLVLGFMYVVGFSASVIRASFLAAVMLISRNFRKDQDSFTTLALVGLICIMQNPYITRDIGAMLSYTASAGLVVTNSWCAKRNISANKRNFLCAASAVIFTLPVLSLAGMSVTLLSPVFNLLLGGFIAVICVLAVITPILNLIPGLSVINSVLVPVNTKFIGYLLAILDFIEHYFTFALINLAHPAFLCTLCVTLTTVFIAYIQSGKVKYIKIFITAVSILTFVCYNLLDYNTVTVRAFDSGRECSFHISARGKEYLVLTEDLTEYQAQNELVYTNGTRYSAIYYCPKETKNYIDLSGMTDNFIEVNSSAEYTNEIFTLNSVIEKNKRLFTVTVADCDISFGHGKITSNNSEYYFLGNDKPQRVTAGEIYIFGNIPSWMEVENIYPVNSDITIKINRKTGKYKTAEDVYNFG